MPVVAARVRHPVGGVANLVDAKELPLLLARGDLHQARAALDIQAQAKLVVGFIDCEDIHEPTRVLDVRPHRAVHFHQASSDDEADLAGGERIAKAVSQNE
eukprot:121871_1